jgi:hypothetical protein
VWAQVQGLRAAYEDVTLRLPAAGSPATIFRRAESFVRLEAELPSGPDAVSPGSVWPLVQSWELEELTYRLVSTVRLVSWWLWPAGWHLGGSWGATCYSLLVHGCRYITACMHMQRKTAHSTLQLHCTISCST